LEKNSVSKAPLVSVIVPVFNAERYLERCIESIVNQTYSPIEIILVNDGSTDGSFDICKRYRKSDARISVISQVNQGPNCARKLGLQKAKGKLIGFVDSDDWIAPEMYEKMVQIYEQYHAKLISTGIYRDYENERWNQEFCDHFAEGFYQNLERDIYPTMLRNAEVGDFGLYCTLVNKLFLRDQLIQVYETLNTEIFFGEDALTLYKYCLLSDSVYISRSSYYHYCIHPGSICRKEDEKLLYNAYLLYKELKGLFIEHPSSHVLMRQLKRYMLDIESHNMRTLFDIDVEVLGKWKFQYENYVDARIVLYGAGQCGQALHHQLCMQHKEKNIVAWVDEKFRERTEQCSYQIDSVERLSEIRFDYVIIAVLDSVLADQIKKKLMETYGIAADRIIWKEAQHEPFFDEVI
jgi:glycosyltransferase involved in cell wall biosynthesis